MKSNGRFLRRKNIILKTLGKTLPKKNKSKLKGEIEKEKDNFYFSNSDEIFKTANSIEAKSGCTHSILRNYLEEIWKEISPPKILPLCPQVR